MKPTTGNNEPGSGTIQTSLDRCLVDGDPGAMSSDRRLRRKSLGISFAIETAALALLITSPLLTSVAQPNFSRPAVVQYVFGAKHAQQTVVHPSPPATHPRNKYFGGIIFPVDHAPLQPAPLPGEMDAPTIQDGGPFPGQLGSEVFQIEGLQPMDPVIPLRDAIKKSDESRPLRVTESILQAQLISRIEPRYPSIALQTRTQGTVRLHAIISRDGKITALEVLSGHPFLVPAALDAVRQWRYRPTMLHGEPVEVETSITVYFRLE
jgi:TonB family protein